MNARTVSRQCNLLLSGCMLGMAACLASCVLHCHAPRSPAHLCMPAPPPCRANPGRELLLTVDRQGEMLSIPVTPAPTGSDGSGRIGISLAANADFLRIKPDGPIQVCLWAGWQGCWAEQKRASGAWPGRPQRMRQLAESSLATTSAHSTCNACLTECPVARSRNLLSCPPADADARCGRVC